ncbi:MAG: hypothetical protein JW850_09045 [Thermoflexales bacterium]|nr:hypothetical protein [Thermoflexales bacterium]
MNLPVKLLDPPREFSVMPFWFWNDALDEGEIVEQIRDFERHGVYGFVIHPRVGLPRELGWMSQALLRFYRLAIEEARRRGMVVVLYDEGMYPSGSSCGQVVAANPDFACRCLAKIDLAGQEGLSLKAGENLLAIVPRHDGSLIAIIDRKADSVIRGIHYVGEGPAEEEPPAADLLNPAAVATFIRLVYDGFAEHFAEYFGDTILAIFTDEPGLLGRCRERDVYPGTTGILEHINRILGYDFIPHLPALWYDDEPDAQRFRRDYERAVHVRLEETYYSQLFAWCEQNGLPLTGHPHKGDDIGALRYFHMPGQDTVWRWVLPDHPSALEGPESTQAKCASSAMIHAGRKRNINECCGAYGHELTWEEMCWLAHWCFVRGTNLLCPHAFYYSIRGPRRDERPPDVGPNSLWWERYSQYADACRRLSWLNTDCVHICKLAILGRSDYLPWRSAKTCFCHQRDFNYVEERDLIDRATIDREGIHIAGMSYRALIVEHDPEPATMVALEPFERSGRIIRCTEDTPGDWLVDCIDRLVPRDICVVPATPSLRVRHTWKGGFHYYLVFNEAKTPVEVAIDLHIPGDVPLRNGALFDPFTGQMAELPQSRLVRLAGHTLQVILIAAPLCKARRGGSSRRV